MDKLLQDLRHAGRSLTKSPGFTAVIVVTLGLAIGANSTIFSVVNGVLLQPLPYEDPEQIVQVAEVGRQSIGDEVPSIASQRLFLAWRDNNQVFDGIAMYSNQQATLGSLDEPVRLTGLAASPALFPLLGVDARLGRTFTAEEEEPGNDDVIILSNRAWQRYFGGDEATLGRRIELDRRPRTVVGITPAGFQFPDSSVEYWVPVVIEPITEETDPQELMRSSQLSVNVTRSEEAGGPGRRGGPGGRQAGPGGQRGGPEGPGGGQELHQIELFGRMVARLRQGVSLERAAEEGTALLRGVREGEGMERERRVELLGFQEQIVGGVRSSLMILMGSVGFVLLIACANVANLVLARSGVRRRETAVRAALGAGRGQLIRLLLVESVLLALLGGVVGLFLALGGLSILSAIGPDFIPRLDEVAIDWSVLQFTFLVSLLTGALFSLAPARGATALDLTHALKEVSGMQGHGRSAGRFAFRRLLVAAEVALCVVLLVGAGLLVSSFVRLVSVDPGYDADNLLLLQVSLPEARYASADGHLNYYDQLVESLERLGGVESVTVVNQPPSVPSNMQIAMSMRQSDEPPAPDQRPTPVGVRIVENGYFEALRMNIVRGRGFEDSDRANTQPVIVLSQAGAEALFGDEDPLGEMMPFMGGRQMEVVGIAEDVRTAGLDPAPQADIFMPYRQATAQMIPMIFRTANVLVRTGPAPLNVLPAIRTQIQQLDAEVPILSVVTMRDRLAESVAEPRFYASLVVAFASVALVLAVVGIYGLLSYTVQQRVRETAIRKALGAQAGQILKSVVTQGMVLTVIGLVIGLGASVALTRVLESMLYEVTPNDPVTTAAVATLFLLVALLAVWVPARRATRIDPMSVLREE